MESAILSDCTQVLTDGKKFTAHRNILAAHSPVFAAMFQNEMKEKATGICKVDDATSDVLDVLIRYAYTHELTYDESSQLCARMDELWMAADKCDMKTLRSACEVCMAEWMERSNALRYLVFAQEHGITLL
ncbi:uncharacterized protein LOC129582844 [Paramacrobiotus metropolitanus]|uniref:uncharacterized protein LOC129582844 n=1 Tax=Paramacrobiotus metropolitanus TaxID=2943436 RepID=UPI00244640A6|nr:uncharacterized protein LOC129582844 [Paramacrobiotus metropolitanus]